MGSGSTRRAWHRLKSVTRAIGKTRVGSRSGWKGTANRCIGTSKTVSRQITLASIIIARILKLTLHNVLQTGTQLYNIVATQMQRQNASLVYTKPPRQPSSSSSKPQAVAKQPSATSGSKAKPKKSAKSGTAPAPSKSSPSTVKPGPRPPRPPHPYPSMEDRFPLNSPLLALGVAVEAVKRDVEQEKENLKKGIGAPGGGAGADGEGKGQPKMPKMKKIMVRKR